MLYVIGLGNPGTRYKETRHNVGFLFLDYYQEEIQAKEHKPETFHYYAGSVGSQKAIFVKPQTYMNLSGEILPKLRQKFGPPDMIIVIYDDAALPVGRLRIRKNGSSGGHNGIQSIIERYGSMEFGRIRIGIADNPDRDLRDHVLGRISKEEMTIYRELFPHIAKALETIVTQGYDAAMAKFNGIGAPEKEKPPKKSDSPDTSSESQ